MSYSLPPYLEPSISKVTQMLLTRSSAIQFRGVSILQSGGYAIYYGGVTSFVLPGPNDPLTRYIEQHLPGSFITVVPFQAHPIVLNIEPVTVSILNKTTHTTPSQTLRFNKLLSPRARNVLLLVCIVAAVVRAGYQAYNTDALVEGSGTSKGSTHFSLQGHKPFRHFDAETDGADAEPPGRIASLVYFLGRFAYHLVDGFTVGLLGLSVSAYNHFTTTPLKKM